MNNQDTAQYLPVFSPLQNLREMVKQMCLIEDHLCQISKRCPDCITKHFLTLEALAEEGVTLSPVGELRDVYRDFSVQIRRLQSEWIDGYSCDVIAQEFRAMRKPLMQHVFDHRQLDGQRHARQKGYGGCNEQSFFDSKAFQTAAITLGAFAFFSWWRQHE